MDLALATCLELPEPDPDAAPLEHALERAGIRTAVLAWDDPRVDWSQAALTVLRSTWNYPTDRAGFLGWAERVARVSRLSNPLSVLRWNTHKGYLLDLARRGLPVTPTVLLHHGSAARLASIAATARWSEVVVKPAVSAASFRTKRFGPAEMEAGQAHMDVLLRERDVLVQRYLASVEDHGERALVWIDGELTHAVRKSPRFEGAQESVSREAVAVSPDEAALARQVMAAVPDSLLYARIDVAPGPDGKPVLMELELVEPSLFFAQAPRALELFVSAVRRRLRDAPLG